MSVSEQDIEMLETWLDGELPDEMAGQLRKRLSVESDLHQVMDRLRSDRQMRAQLWPTFEGSEAEAATLISSVRASIVKDHVWSIRLRALRNVSAVAASIAIVFTAGWISHSRLNIANTDSTPAAVNPQVAINTPTNNEIQFRPLSRNFNLTSASTSGVPNIQSAAYLQILDRNGRVIARQPLDAHDDPQKLVADMSRFNSRQFQQQQRSSPVLVDTPAP